MEVRYLESHKMREYELERREWEMRKSYILQRQKTIANMMKYSLILLGAVIVLMYLIIPVKGILEKYEARLSAEVEGMQQIPSLKKEIVTLQKQLTALTTDSIENRLSIIEENIRVGKIDPTEVKAIQDLNHDFQILKTYMFRDPEELVELKQLQKNYQELKDKSDVLIERDDVMREVAFLNNLFYASIGLFGLLLAVMSGSWLQSNRKLRLMDEKLAESMEELSESNNTEQDA